MYNLAALVRSSVEFLIRSRGVAEPTCAKDASFFLLLVFRLGHVFVLDVLPLSLCAQVRPLDLSVPVYVLLDSPDPTSGPCRYRTPYGGSFSPAFSTPGICRTHISNAKAPRKTVERNMAFFRKTELGHR